MLESNWNCCILKTRFTWYSVSEYLTEHYTTRDESSLFQACGTLYSNSLHIHTYAHMRTQEAKILSFCFSKTFKTLDVYITRFSLKFSDSKKSLFLMHVKCVKTIKFIQILHSMQFNWNTFNSVLIIKLFSRKDLLEISLSEHAENVAKGCIETTN